MLNKMILINKWIYRTRQVTRFASTYYHQASRHWWQSAASARLSRLLQALWAKLGGNHYSHVLTSGVGNLKTIVRDRCTTIRGCQPWRTSYPRHPHPGRHHPQQEDGQQPRLLQLRGSHRHRLRRWWANHVLLCRQEDLLITTHVHILIYRHVYVRTGIHPYINIHTYTH